MSENTRQVILDDKLHSRFKQKCAKLGVTMREVIESLINKFLKEMDGHK